MIVIPMAGFGRRFNAAGYALPKYMLPAHGRTLFAHAVSSFAALFDSHPFLFVYRDIAGTGEFVRSECKALGIADAAFCPLRSPTDGQAETVARGLQAASVPGSEPVTVFNVDTIRPRFAFPEDPDIVQAGGFLEVFRGSGSGWSYVLPQPGSDHRVVKTAEKKQISDLCCTGLYHFRNRDLYAEAYEEQLRSETRPAGELYVAPIYNFLIRRGIDIRFRVIGVDEVTFCGVPAEYEAFLEGRADHGAAAAMRGPR